MRASAGLILVAALGAPANAQNIAPERAPTPFQQVGWAPMEAPYLTHHVQLTSRERFLKAGEAYFSPDSRWIVFQAVPAEAVGTPQAEFYAMYIAGLVRDSAGLITGIEEPIRISPEGSANTCGWFHPTDPGRVMFASTMDPPSVVEASGYQVGRNRYIWRFPPEMEVVETVVPEIVLGLRGRPHVGRARDGEPELTRVFSRPDYDAECSWSSDGRFVLYSHVRETRQEHEKADADIWVFDTRSGRHHILVDAEGYDGGPFFSPDDRMICYRSDRTLNNLLQVYIAELEFDGDGVPVGIRRELPITANTAVNWGPFWHPSGRYLVYGTSEVGHTNYEVFAVEVDLEKSVEQLRTRRITYANGADILPAFSPDGRLMMWTAQRGEMAADEAKPSSQLWIAHVDQSLRFEDVFRRIGEAEAIARGWEALKDRSPWGEEVERTAQAVPDGWMVTAWQLPKSPRNWRRVLLAPDGRVLRFIDPGQPGQ